MIERSLKDLVFWKQGGGGGVLFICSRVQEGFLFRVVMFRVLSLIECFRVTTEQQGAIFCVIHILVCQTDPPGRELHISVDIFFCFIKPTQLGVT